MYVNIIIYSNKLLFVWSTLKKVKKTKQNKKEGLFDLYQK